MGFVVPMNRTPPPPPVGPTSPVTKKLHQINMAECLSGTEVAELLENADQWVSPTSSEELSGGGKRRKRPLLVHPPQLPVNDSALRGRDEDDVLKLESFFRQV